MNLASEICPICHRPATLTQAGHYRHEDKIIDRLCKIQLEIYHLKLEERDLQNQLTTATPLKPGEGIKMITHRVVMEFGTGLTRNRCEIYTGTEEECQEYFDNLPTSGEIPDAYERTQPFRERSWVEEIEEGDDPRWP